MIDEHRTRAELSTSEPSRTQANFATLHPQSGISFGLHGLFSGVAELKSDDSPVGNIDAFLTSLYEEYTPTEPTLEFSSIPDSQYSNPTDFNDPYVLEPGKTPKWGPTTRRGQFLGCSTTTDVNDITSSHDSLWSSVIGQLHYVASCTRANLVNVGRLFGRRMD
jgi:hypothetical protein